jgi:hypothetical protein
MKIQPYSAVFLAMGGMILTGLGLYFVFLRPPLLPEDPRYMGTTLEEIQSAIPGLLIWLRRVFWVMGGFMISTGVLTMYIALTVFQSRAKGVMGILSVAGLISIGWMAIVNFLIDSDFKWLILAFTFPWLIALGLYRIEGTAQNV